MKLKRVFTITVKELNQIKRDKKIYPLLFIAPILQLIVFGYAATLETKNTPTGVLDQDRTYMSRQYIESFAHNSYFDVCCFAESRKELCRLLDEGKIKLGIDIPVDFQKKLKSGKSTQVQLFVDGTESNGATIALTYANIISQRFSSNLILKHIDTASFNSGDFLGTWLGEKGKEGIVEDELRIWYNPALSSKNYFVPGIICMILLVLTTNLTAISIVKEREIGTLEQLLVSPATRTEMLLGKLTPYIGIGLCDVALIVIAAVLFFKVPVMGSIPLLFLFSLFYLFTSLGLGLFISTITHTQEQAMIITFFFVITMILLSGIMFPIENMPQIIQYFTYLMPIRYFAIIVRSIFLKGTGIDVLWIQGLCLLVLGLSILLLSILRFKKKIT